MTRETKPAVILLAICAVADIVSTPPLLFASGNDGPPIWLGVCTGVLGVLTAAAAFGWCAELPGPSRWRRPDECWTSPRLPRVSAPPCPPRSSCPP